MDEPVNNSDRSVTFLHAKCRQPNDPLSSGSSTLSISRNKFFFYTKATFNDHAHVAFPSSEPT